MISVEDYIREVISNIDSASNKEKSIIGIRGVIDFDIATIADQKGKAGFKVSVVGFGGELGGELANQSVSRVRFSIQTKGAINPARGDISHDSF